MTNKEKPKRLQLEIPGIVKYCRAQYPTKAKVVDGKEFPSTYSVDLVVTKQSVVDKLLKLDARRATKEDKTTGTTVLKEFEDTPGAVFRISQRAEIEPGRPANPPFVHDKNGNPLPKTELIGDGSRVIVTANLYPNKYKKCMQLGLVGVTVLDLVEVESTMETVDLCDDEDKKGSYESSVISLDDNDDLDDIPFDHD